MCYTHIVTQLLQSGDGGAFQQADSWVASASAWAARLLAAFPLYRDLLQPVALAVHEMRAGLAMLVCAQKGLNSAGQDEHMGLVIAQLGALTESHHHKGVHDVLPVSSLSVALAHKDQEHEHCAIA